MSGKRAPSLHAFGFTCTQAVKRTRRAVPGIQSLPTDVLQLILMRVAERPRLLALSPVCKRWRTLILRTITSLSWHVQPSDERRLPLVRMLEQLPSLTSLTLYNDYGNTVPFTPNLPPTLTRLETGSFGPLSRLVAPRKLIFTGTCDLLDALPSALSSISELELRNASDWWVFSPQFRSLRTLAMHNADLGEGIPRTFLVTHARHLQHLSLHNCCLIERYLYGAVFAPRLPALRTLHLEDSPDHEQFLAIVLQTNPGLECVTIGTPTPVTNGQLCSGIALRVVNKASATEEPAPTIADCESVVISNLLPMAHIHLPRVTRMSLMLSERPLAFFDLVQRVSHFARAAPQLHTLQLSLPNIGDEEQHLWELQNALQQVVQCGVQRLVAEFEGPVPLPLQAFFSRLTLYGWVHRATLRSRRVNRAPLEESDEDSE